MPHSLQPGLPVPQIPPVLRSPADDAELVQRLNEYRLSAADARKNGPHARDDVWRDNLHLYWGRLDYSKKAAWQSKEVMPEAPVTIDRWAAALKQALFSAGAWYTVVDVADKEQNLALTIQKFLDVQLSRCARTPTGQEVGFEGLIEDILKMGAMKALCAAVSWKIDNNGLGYCAIEIVDPLEVWFDPTGRGMYRIRRYEIDKYALMAAAKQTDEAGNPLYNMETIELLRSEANYDDQQRKKETVGHSVDDNSTRRSVVVLDEYLCTILNVEGEVEHENCLCVVANEKYLIRGPEKNPYAHGRDWLVFTPVVSVPLSQYGRTYMENWSSICHAFIVMTNLIIDAAYFASLNVFCIDPDNVREPEELREGVYPGKTIQLEGGVDARTFLSSTELGRVSPALLSIWEALKNEIREGAAINEIALGQLAPKADVTATEITQTQQSSAAQMSSIATMIETKFLEPLLTTMWLTSLQHLSEDDKELEAAVGAENFSMFLERRDEFISTFRLKFRVRGISEMLERSKKFRALTILLQTVMSNPVLQQQFLSVADPQKLLAYFLGLLGIDPAIFAPSPRDAAIAAVTQPNQAEAAPSGSPPAPIGQPSMGAI